MLPKDAFALLQADHRGVKIGFEQFEKTNSAKK